MGAREKKKQELQDKIVAAAKELFLSKDFDEVTMSQIAKQAGVGLGTAYNYYESKEELFLIAGGTSFLFGNGMALEKPLTNLADLSRSIAKGMQPMTDVSRDMWKTALSSLTKAAEKKPGLFLELIAIDQDFLSSIETVLSEFQNKQIIKSLVDIKSLLGLIYSTLFTNFLMFIYDEEQTIADFEAKIEASFACLFQGIEV